MASRQLDEEAIFHVARGIPCHETRTKYLEQVCAGDQNLRNRVEELLKVHEQEEAFLKSSPDPGPTADLPPVSESAGQRIGRYKLLQKIGEGGFGVVYMADQQRPVRRKVALKIIKPGMDTRQVIARFEAERQALALMDHPNIARVLDAGATESGRPFFVMELVKGVPVTEYCDKNSLSTEARLRLFIDICRAVQHAHQKGLIHRDLKPANIMVTLHDGHPVPKVIDFGVSKAISQQLTEKTLFTSYGQMIGTPQYMSPEQAEMSGLDIDTRSDVYSLGVLLYELLTGTTPLESDRLRTAGYAEMQRIIREEEPPRPSIRLSTSRERLTILAKNRACDPARLQQLIRGELDWIVMKSLAKERERRYDSASSLATDVNRYLAHEPVEACSPSLLYRVRKFVRRNRLVVAAAVALGLSLVLGLAGTSTGLVFAMMKTRIAREEQGRAEQSRLEAETARAEAEEQTKRKQRLLYGTHMSQAGVGLSRHDLQLIRRLLDKYEPSEGEDDLRHWEWFYLSQQYARSAPTSEYQLGQEVFRLDVSPDKKWLAVAHPERYVLTLINLDTKMQKCIEEFERNTWQWNFVAFSNDSRVLVYPSSDLSCVLLRNMETKEVRRIGNAEGETKVSCASFSPDNQTLAIGMTNGTVALHSLDTGALLGRLEKHTDCVRAMAFSPDGVYLATGGGNLKDYDTDCTIRLWNVEARDEQFVLKGHTAPVFGVAFSADGRYLATCGADRSLRLWNPETGQLIRVLTVAEDQLRSVAFSPDNKTLSAGHRNSIVTVWSLPDFERIGQLSGCCGLYALDYLRDGTIVHGSITKGIVFRKPPSLAEEGILRSDRNVRDVVFSSDNEELMAVASAPAPEIQRWDLKGHSAVPLPAIATSFDVACIATSVRGQVAAGASDSATVQVFETCEGQVSALLPGSDATSATCIAFSANGDLLAVGCDNGRIVIWRVDDRHIQWERQVCEVKVHSLVFCADNTTLLVGNHDGRVSLCNFQTGESVELPGTPEIRVHRVACSPDGRFLAASFAYGEQGPAARKIIVWDRATLQPTVLHGHKMGVHSIGWLHDRETLISAGGDRMIKIWDVPTGQERLTINDDWHIYTCMAISSDDRIVAAGCRDGRIYLHRAGSAYNGFPAK